MTETENKVGCGKYIIGDFGGQHCGNQTEFHGLVLCQECKEKENKEVGVWIVYDLEANREIQGLLTNKKFAFRFDPYLRLIREQGEKEILEIIGSKELREKLADLEHQQWIHLIKYIKGLSEVDLNYFVTCGWNNKLIDYEQLIEEDKEKDRTWADKVIQELKTSIRTNDNTEEIRNRVISERQNDMEKER